MTRELFWLTLTIILTGVLWVPYILNRAQVLGYVDARDRAAAERAAVAEFNLSDERRKRLVVQERG